MHSAAITRQSVSIQRKSAHKNAHPQMHKDADVKMFCIQERCPVPAATEDACPHTAAESKLTRVKWTVCPVCFSQCSDEYL